MRQPLDNQDLINRAYSQLDGPTYGEVYDTIGRLEAENAALWAFVRAEDRLTFLFSEDCPELDDWAVQHNTAVDAVDGAREVLRQYEVEE